MNYEFDAVNQVFRMTESFARRASQVGTEEYRVFLKVRRDYPDIKVEKLTRKKGGKKLNYDMMKNYIKLQENADTMEKEFERQKCLSRVQPMPYMYVKKWFDENYPEYYDWQDTNGQKPECTPADQVEPENDSEAA